MLQKLLSTLCVLYFVFYQWLCGFLALVHQKTQFLIVTARLMKTQFFITQSLLASLPLQVVRHT